MPCAASASGSFDSSIWFCCAISCKRVVQRLVRDFHAGLFGALQLDLLEHQPFEHLLAQHVLRRKLQFLLAHALGDRRDLLIKLAREHHAVIHHRRHAIEHSPLVCEIAGLGVRDGLHQKARPRAWRECAA